jgi:hypothetical protein
VARSRFASLAGLAWWLVCWLWLLPRKFGGGGGILRVAHSRVKGAFGVGFADDGLGAVTFDSRV